MLSLKLRALGSSTGVVRPKEMPRCAENRAGGDREDQGRGQPRLSPADAHSAFGELTQRHDNSIAYPAAAILLSRPIILRQLRTPDDPQGSVDRQS